MPVAQPSRLQPTLSAFRRLGKQSLEKRTQDIRRGSRIRLTVPRGYPRVRNRALVTGGMRHARSGPNTHINTGKHEEPAAVDEMPVPGGKLEGKMLRRREMSKI